MEWLSKGVQTTNELRVWLEEMTRNDANLQKEDWELLFEFYMVAEKVNPNDKKISVLAMEVEPVIATDPKFYK